jgi:hypothetical protein
MTHQGGQAVVDAVLNGGHSFLYTESHMDVVVRAFCILTLCVHIYMYVLFMYSFFHGQCPIRRQSSGPIGGQF